MSGSGRASGDTTVWKRNFRSALRAKGFKLVSDNKNDNANPHKVFRWPEESASASEAITILPIKYISVVTNTDAKIKSYADN